MTNNRGGRPTKQPSEKRRYPVQLKLNTIEYYTLKRRAAEAGVNRNESLRMLIADAKIQARITPEQMHEIRQLTGMANNINQIARSLNTYEIRVIPEELERLRELITQHLKELKP